MDKNKIQIAVTAVLVVVLILVSINSIHRIKKKLSPAKLPAAVPLAVSAPQQAGSAPVVSTQAAQDKYAEIAKLEWIRDPFSDKIYLSTKGEIDLNLSGILWDEKKPSAIISDKVVNEGDTIGKYTVLKINKENVILNDGVQNIDLVIGK
ncbi:MAG: hypothetical protein ABIH18_07640 [Candidatus Omnitrophota bacterium]